MSGLWVRVLFLATAASVATRGQCVGDCTNVSATCQNVHGDGWGLPGTQASGAHVGTLVLTSNGKTVSVPLGFVGINGTQAQTKLDFFPLYNPNDAISFLDNHPSISNDGRAGTGNFNWGAGAFSVATGSINYDFGCSGFCFDGKGSPVAGFFIFTLSCSISLTMQTALADAIFPNTVSTPTPTQTGTPAGGTADDYKGLAGQSVNSIMDTSSSPPTQHLRSRANASSASGDGGSLTLNLPLQPVDYTYSVTATCPTLPAGCWMTVPAAGGAVSGFNNASVTADFDAGSLGTGVYPANIALTVTPSGSAAPTTRNVPFDLIVTGGAPLLQISEAGVQFQASAGQSPVAHSIAVSSFGTAATFQATASTLAGGNWLSVTPASGAAPSSSLTTVTITADPTGMAPGSYYGRVDFSAPGAVGSPQSVEAVLTVAPAAPTSPSFSTTGLVFVAPQFTNPAFQTVKVTTLSSQQLILSTAIDDGGMSWLTVSSSSSVLTSFQPVTQTISVSTSGLNPGVYPGTIHETSSGTATDQLIPITLIVTPGSGTCTPSQLVVMLTNPANNFEITGGLPISVNATIVDDCGSPLTSGAVQAAFPNGDPPVALTSLGNGQWSGTWQPHAIAAGPGTVTLSSQNSSGLQGSGFAVGTIDANSTATLVTPGGIVNAASLAAAPPAAPGEFISIFGSNLAPSTTSSPSYPYATSLAGTQVLLGGQPMPLQFVSPGQINALVPFGTPVNGLQQLLVKQNNVYAFPETLIVGAASPAVFTANQTGQGAGAIVVIKANGTQFESTATAPASAGDTLVIYCEGLGAVNPPVADGAAASLTTLSRTVNPVTVTVGGQQSPVLFAGLAPGFAGLYQVNVTVPSGVTAGASVPVILTVAGFSSLPVTVAIQ
jgi:uncharacterized protein (TIGR03437 family)